jgi:hypothetical protein
LTSEELVDAGLLPIRKDIHDSGSREDEEVRSEDKSGGEEDLADVDADPNELVAAKSAKSYPPAFVFGESKVTLDLIKEYEAAEFFPVGDARASFDEQVPILEANEVVVFQDFFTCGLRFPYDFILPSILERFSVKIHQPSPNSLLELSKFFWTMKTFKCTFSADIFVRLFELVIEKDILKLDDGQYYEAHYACCTFNTHKQNSRKRSDPNSACSLLQDQLPQRLEFVLVLREGQHVQNSWLHRAGISSLLAYRGGNCHLNCSIQLLSSWFQEL